MDFTVASSQVQQTNQLDQMLEPTIGVVLDCCHVALPSASLVNTAPALASIAPAIFILPLVSSAYPVVLLPYKAARRGKTSYIIPLLMNYIHLAY
jgi:hypothetical protein